MPRPTWDHQALLRALLTKVGRRNQGWGLEEETSEYIALEEVTIGICGVLPAGATGRLPSCILLTDLGPLAMCTYLCQSDRLYVHQVKTQQIDRMKYRFKTSFHPKSFILLNIADHLLQESSSTSMSSTTSLTTSVMSSMSTTFSQSRLSMRWSCRATLNGKNPTDKQNDQRTDSRGWVGLETYICVSKYIF